LRQRAGFTVLRGNLFESAIMKTSVISEEFRRKYLSDPDDPEAFEGHAVVFDGPEDYHDHIDDPALGIDANTVMFIRGAGPVGYPGSAEVVNMRPPAALIRAGIDTLPCVGDGRQSGTSGSPSILNASPEAAAGGGLALLKSGDRVRIDMRRGEANMRLPDSGEPVTLAGDAAPHGRPIRNRRRARDGNQVPATRAEIPRAAAQSLRGRNLRIRKTYGSTVTGEPSLPVHWPCPLSFLFRYLPLQGPADLHQREIEGWILTALLQTASPPAKSQTLKPPSTKCSRGRSLLPTLYWRRWVIRPEPGSTFF